MMKVVVVPPTIRIGEDDAVVIPTEQMPDAPLGFAIDKERPVIGIHFEGHMGRVERRSRVLGYIDIEHFTGIACLQPYLDALAREKQRLADEKKRQAEEASALAEQSANRNAEMAASPPTQPAMPGNPRVTPNTAPKPGPGR